MLIFSLLQVNVFKPATSKAGNSEVYVVALDYQAGLPLDRFMEFLGVWTTLYLLRAIWVGVVTTYAMRLHVTFLSLLTKI